MKNYCINCAISRNIYNPVSSCNLIQNSYQIDKYRKHTAPTSAYPNLNSVFTDPSTLAYKDYIDSTINSGSIEVDDRNRVNIISVASTGTGISFKDGIFLFTTDAVKVVCHDDPFKIHAFPIRSTGEKKCDICGKLTIENKFITRMQENNKGLVYTFGKMNYQRIKV